MENNFNRITLGPSVYSARLEVVAFMLLVFLGSYFSDLPGMVLGLELGPLKIHLPWLLLPIVFLFAYLARADTKHLLGRTRVRSLSGFYSFHTTEVEIRYEDIVFVQVTQSLLDRFFDVGMIQLGRSTDSAAEISMKGLRRPGQLALELKRRIKQAKRNAPGQN